MASLSGIVEGMVVQNTTRPHFSYVDRVIKYLIHPELIASEVSQLSIIEQCLLVRDFMNRNTPEPFVRAEPFGRETPLPATSFTQKIIRKNSEQQQSRSSSPGPKSNLNQISTPISPPSSPVSYPLSDTESISDSDTFSLSDDINHNASLRTISAAEALTKLPQSAKSYLEKRKKPLHHLAIASRIVVTCHIKLEDLERVIPHVNLKKLIKYMINVSMAAPPTVLSPKSEQNPTPKYVLKSKAWKPRFQRWVINSLIESGSSDVLGHTAKHITNIQRGADTAISVLTYYMRLTTATKSKRSTNSKTQTANQSKAEVLTKPNWEPIENGNGAKMFTLKGESSDEVDREPSGSLSDGERSKESSSKCSSVSSPEPSKDCNTNSNSKSLSKEEKKRIAIRKYYTKWSAIYGEDVSHLSALQVQTRCVEKYEVCCDIARYYFIRENWTKSKKWFNRSHRWCLRIDRKNLPFEQMITHQRYRWESMLNIIAVLDVILKMDPSPNPNDTKSTKKEKEENDGEHNNIITSDTVHNQIYECCRHIADHNKSSKTSALNENAVDSLPGLLIKSCSTKESLNMLSVPLLTVWINEIAASNPESPSIGFLNVFMMSLAAFKRCSVDPTEWKLESIQSQHGLLRRWKIGNLKLLSFCGQSMDKMHSLLDGTQKVEFEKEITRNIHRIVHDISSDIDTSGSMKCLLIMLEELQWIDRKDIEKWKKETESMRSRPKQKQNSSSTDSNSMDVDDDKEFEEMEESQNLNERLFFVKDSKSMNIILKELMDSEDRVRYNQAINLCIDRCYDLVRRQMDDQKGNALNEWMDPIQNVLLSMINKHNRDQIAFLKLIHSIHCSDDIDQIMGTLAMKLNGITVPSFNGLYALFHCCFAKMIKISADSVPSTNPNVEDDAKEHNRTPENIDVDGNRVDSVDSNRQQTMVQKQAVRKLVNMVCNHLYSVLFAKQREHEKMTRKMRDCNRVHQQQYASMMYQLYADQESLLNLLIHQNTVIEKCESSTNRLSEEEAKKVLDALHRFVSHLTQNIRFKPLPEMEGMNGMKNVNDDEMDYLYPMESGNAMDLFCDETTKFMISIYAHLIGDDFMDILGPLIVGLIHVTYSRSKCKKYRKRCPSLFGSFRGDKYYEFVMNAGIRSGGSWIDEGFSKLIAQNMNPLLTFLYFGYLSVWKKRGSKLLVLHHCSDLLIVKGKERLALQLLVDTSCCLMKSDPFNSQKTYVSNEYGLIWNDQRLLAQFIGLCQINGRKMEAVLLWQLSTHSRRIENALDIVRNALSVQDVVKVVKRQEENGGENVFQFIWEPLIFCAFKEKFSALSSVIDKKMDEYLESIEMGTDPKLKATKLCDFVLNKLLVN